MRTVPGKMKQDYKGTIETTNLAIVCCGLFEYTKLTPISFSKETGTSFKKCKLRSSKQVRNIGQNQAHIQNTKIETLQKTFLADKVPGTSGKKVIIMYYWWAGNWKSNPI